MRREQLLITPVCHIEPVDVKGREENPAQRFLIRLGLRISRFHPEFARRNEDHPGRRRLACLGAQEVAPQFYLELSAGPDEQERGRPGRPGGGRFDVSMHHGYSPDGPGDKPVPAPLTSGAAPGLFHSRGYRPARASLPREDHRAAMGSGSRRRMRRGRNPFEQILRLEEHLHAAAAGIDGPRPDLQKLAIHRSLIWS